MEDYKAIQAGHAQQRDEQAYRAGNQYQQMQQVNMSAKFEDEKSLMEAASREKEKEIEKIKETGPRKQNAGTPEPRTHTAVKPIQIPVSCIEPIRFPKNN